MAGVAFGVSVGGSFPQGVPPASLLLDVARDAEAAGFDSLWSGDHVMMFSPIVECVSLLSALAAVTSRVRLGSGVYLLPLRHPVNIAKMFAGVDYLSNGRLLFGIGVGGEYAKEFEAVGVPHAERGARTDEALDVIIRLWTERRASFEGRFFRFRDVALEPPPVQRPRPPIWVGGRSDAALRRTARAGDGWLAYMATADRIRAGRAKIAEFAAAEGRAGDGVEIGLLVFAYVAEREAARRRVVADLSARYNQPFDTLVDRYCAFGPAADCAAAIGRFLDAGVGHLVVKFTCAPDEQMDQQRMFAEEVVPLLRR